jgi:hypothetical protein
MYEQDMIFGPLAFKQFIVLFIGAIFSYAIYKNSENYIVIGIIISCAFYLVFYVFKNKKIPLNEIRQYFAIKKSELSQDQYKIIIKQKIANIESQIEFRKQKGLVEDPSLVEVLNIIKAL